MLVLDRKILKIRRRWMLHISPCPIALCDSIPLDCKAKPTSFSLVLNPFKVNGDCLSNPMVSEKPLHTVIQYVLPEVLY